MILCIGSAADDTFVHTLGRLAELGTDFDALDLAHLAMAGTLTGPVADPSALEIHAGDGHFALGAYEAIYNRMLDISNWAPSDELGERSVAVSRVLSQAVSAVPVRVVNRPAVDISNAAKLYHQVSVARRGGFLAPRSVLSTSVRDAVEFIEGCPRGAIVKGSSARKTWVSVLRPTNGKYPLARLSECPSLIQERICGADVRVHVVGPSVFAESVRCDEPDYRCAQECKYESVTLPDEIAARCIWLAADLGLTFAGIDFKMDEESGEFVFLEANAMPCYQGYDRRAGGRISEALHRWLLTGA
jgi:hypothetical protein